MQSGLAFADSLNPLSQAKEKRLASGRPLVDLADTNPAHAGFAWDVAELGTLLCREGIQRQDPEARGRRAARQAIADYYAGYADTAGIEKRGLAPIKSDLAAIAACGAVRHGSDHLAAGSENSFHLTHRAVKRVGRGE